MLEHVSKSARRIITFAVVTMMMLGSLVAPASAQSQTIQSSLTGVTISYSAPYTLSPDGQFTDANMETMMFVGPADILAMGFMSPLIDLNSARDIFLESLFGEIGTSSTIDRGDYTAVSYSLDMVNIDGFEMGVFSLFMNQRSHGYSEFYVFLAPPSLFGPSMQAAQNAFTIDGNPLMDGVDPIAMGDMVTANQGITGGEAVTDVTDVADPNTTEASTTDPTDTTTTTTAGDDQAARDAYLQELKALYDSVESSLASNAQAFQDVGNEVITVDEGAEIINMELTYLSGTNDRLAAMEVPASMQEFHNSEVVPWGDAVTAAGTTWFVALDGGATQDEAIDAINHGAQVHADFGPKLQAELDATPSTDTSGTSTESSRSTRSTSTTDTTTTEQGNQTQASSGDVDAYLSAISDQRINFLLSLTSFNSHLNSLEGEPTDAQIQSAREGTLAEAELWTSYSATAQQLTPPAGYEGVHEAYLTWAADVTELGNLWIGAMNTDSSLVDAFFDYLPNVQQSEQDLQDAIDAAGTQGSETSTTTETADTGTTRTTRTTDTGDETEETTGTSRTSRTSSSEDDTTDPTEETDAANRTSRTSRTTETTEENNSSETSERPDRTTRTSRSDSGDSGNTSETSGNDTGANATDLPNELYAETTGVDVTWSDELSLDERDGEAVINDPGKGEDQIYFIATTPDGTDVFFSLILQGNAGSDATAFISGLVNNEDTLAASFADDAVIIDHEIGNTQSAILVEATDDIGNYYVYIQVTCVTEDCDTISMLALLVEDGSEMDDALSIVEVGLAVNDTPVVGAITPLESEEAINQLGN